MSQAKSHRREGFTLVELLVSIAIIGTLMALTTAAIWGAIRSARQAKILVEIDHLSQAMTAYKEEQIQYPPSMTNTSITDRRLAFMRHVQLAWVNATTYSASITGYTNTRNMVLNATTGYNYLNKSGSIAQCDLDNLDQAEALVFWLGGFQTPVSTATRTPVASRKLFGFHRDSDNPFKRDAANVEGLEPMRYRTEPKYQFDPIRLIDNDDDGWLEYVPLSPSTGVPTAPYVYFDSAAYVASTSRTTVKHMGYPRQTNAAASPTASQLASVWGIASPMAEYFDNTGGNPTRWARDRTFQIICGGLDGVYTTPVTNLATAQRIPIFPAGQVFDAGSNYGTMGYYSIGELDDLTNLSGKPLEQARNEAQQ